MPDIRIAASGGGDFDCTITLPESGPSPALVIMSSVYGVDEDVRGIADDLAGKGIVTAAPDLFWRGDAGPMPRTFLTRHVHVAETDEQARDEAAEHLATPRMADPAFSPAAHERLAQAGIGPGPDGRYVGEAGTPERLELLDRRLRGDSE